MSALSRFRHGLTLLMVALVVLAASSAPVAAQALGSEVGFTGMAGTVVIDEGQTTDEITGMAGTIVVRGTVTGDISGLAGDVVIAETGTVQGDVSVATGSLRIAGTVGGNVAAGAGNVVLEEGGTVGGDFSVGAGNVDIAGTIEGDATIGAETIVLGPSTVIAGELRYDADLIQQPGSTVQGPVVLDRDIGGGFGPAGWAQPSWRFPAYLDTVYGFFANLILGAILLLVFPGFSRRVAETASGSPARSGGIGFLLLLGIPIALVALVITIIGIPLAILGIFVYLFAIWIGVVYGEYAVGHWLLGRSSDVVNRWYALLLGLLVFAVLGLVPYLGGLLIFLVLLVGLGALASSMRGAYRGRRGSGATPTEATTGEADSSPV